MMASPVSQVRFSRFFKLRMWKQVEKDECEYLLCCNGKSPLYIKTHPNMGVTFCPKNMEKETNNLNSVESVLWFIEKLLIVIKSICIWKYFNSNVFNILYKRKPGQYVLYNFYYLLGKECWKGREGEEEYEPVTAELLVLYSGYMYTQYGIQNRLAYSLHLFSCIFTI